ncbi:MAG: ABC transporter [Clostridia bacterium]|nr:ABC transporter [Clostridia bacterium]
MSAIFKREFQSYFTSPVGYSVLAAYMFFSGLFFYVYCLYPGISSMYAVFQNMFTVVLFLIPIITMRLFSEDKKQKTDQILLTSPIGIPSIVSAKFFSALSILALCLCSYIVEGVALSFYAHPDWSVIIGNIFGMAVLGSAFIAIGIFVSSLTESVIVAAVISFAVNMLISFLDAIASTISWDFLEGIINVISFQQKYANFALGLISFADVIYFASITVFFLFLTGRVIEKRRWD